MATYNRSGPLRHAIQSVVNSTFTDWELIVVGDACTDDTAQCVAGFADPRIRFVNLRDRIGEQSGPNNHGVALSRGRYVAYLSHDDFYLPDHLARCVAELESSGADLVWVPCAVAEPESGAAATDRPSRFTLLGVPGGRDYTPYSLYFASSWVFRRSLADRVGPWPAYAQTFMPPSQSWLFRAWRMGAALRFLPHVSVLLVPAAARPGCYAQRACPEHDRIARWIEDDPNYREHILESAAVGEAMRNTANTDAPRLWAFRRLVLRPAYALLTRLGIHPQSLAVALRHGGRGGVIRDHRRRTGSE